MNAQAQETPFLAEEPQPLLREIPPGEPYPVHALGPLGDAVKAAQDVTQAPIGIAAQSALSVASLAVQGFADVETLGGNVPCSLFCLTIAESGERKSSCDRLLIRGVREHEHAQAEIYRDEFSEYEVSREIWAGKWPAPTEWSGLIVSALSASGPFARRFPGRVVCISERCAA